MSKKSRWGHDRTVAGANRVGVRTAVRQAHSHACRTISSGGSLDKLAGWGHTEVSEQLMRSVTRD